MAYTNHLKFRWNVYHRPAKPLIFRANTKARRRHCDQVTAKSAAIRPIVDNHSRYNYGLLRILPHREESHDAPTSADTSVVLEPKPQKAKIQMRVLVTGGMGYVGSHTCIALIEAGYEVSILDNLSNSKVDVADKIEEITRVRPDFINGDIRDIAALRQVFGTLKYGAVLHFAGKKSVAESVIDPLLYWDVNVNGSLTLVKAMNEAGVKMLVFSSSATVYGLPEDVQMVETSPLKPVNPYGETKKTVERLLQDLTNADQEWRSISLRYFNPAGAHHSGKIGEDPKGLPTNLIPYVGKVASGQMNEVKIFGSDYPTPDGTGIRDYVHVEDIAEGHLAALKHLHAKNGYVSVNLGTGAGYSVLEIIREFSTASGMPIPYRRCERRAGDVPAYYADARLAATLLGWKAKRSLNRMCKDAWNWEQLNLAQKKHLSD